MLKKPIWSAIETKLFYYSGDMYSWSSLRRIGYGVDMVNNQTTVFLQIASAETILF